MIRFIDLRSSEYDIGARFAWWNTISDTFERFGGEMAWLTFADFEESYIADGGSDFARYARLAPEWTKEECGGIKFVLKIGKTLADQLEAMRAKRGLRSRSETIRALLAEAMK